MFEKHPGNLLAKCNEHVPPFSTRVTVVPTDQQALDKLSPTQTSHPKPFWSVKVGKEENMYLASSPAPHMNT